MGFRVPQANLSRNPDSTGQDFPDSRLQIPLHGAMDSEYKYQRCRSWVPKQQWRWAVMTVLLQIKTYDHKCYSEYHKLTFSKQLSKNASKESWEVTNDLCSINRLNICVLVNVWKNFVWELGRLFWNPTKKRITKTCKNPNNLLHERIKLGIWGNRPFHGFFFQVLIKITTSKRISIDTAKKRALF